MCHALFPHRYYIRTTAPISDELVLRRDGNAVITHSMTLTDIHALFDSAINIDPQTFVAGLEDSIE